jgi:membrane associated rhomboid family serine protease
MSILGLQPGLTLAIIAANVILWLILQSNQTLLERMLFVYRSVARDREYDRLIASGFAHHSFFHLLFNMMTLYYFGPTVEMLYGRLGFAVIYVISIGGGNHGDPPKQPELQRLGGLRRFIRGGICFCVDAT